MKTSVSFVVMLLDDFNNKVISGSSARVWIPNEKPPIPKAGGYYVFTDVRQRQFELLVESAMYESQRVEMDLAGLHSPGQIIKLRLVPNRSYLLPSGTTCVEGRAEPGSQIRIFTTRHVNPMKLLYDYSHRGEGAQELKLYHPEEADMEGRLLYIEHKSGTGEFFRILKAGQEAGTYILPEPLCNSYKKIGTALYPVYGARADQRGEFFLPIFPTGKGPCPYTCMAVGNARVRREAVFEAGRLNKMNLMEEEN
ncbi:MAG: hypothetical protein LIP16_04080 [Clostridium sp.]|nr:hypothetical protein [Clostridium sp.]